MASMSLFVDLTDTATQRNPAPTYVISASVLKTPLATVLRPVAPLRKPHGTASLRPFATRGCWVVSFSFLFLFLPFNDHVFWNSHLECGNEGQIAVVMLTKGNSGAVNGLVTCICRSLAGNMEQHGAEVEILQKKLPQIL